MLYPKLPRIDLYGSIVAMFMYITPQQQSEQMGCTDACCPIADIINGIAYITWLIYNIATKDDECKVLAHVRGESVHCSLLLQNLPDNLV